MFAACMKDKALHFINWCFQSRSTSICPAQGLLWVEWMYTNTFLYSDNLVKYLNSIHEHQNVWNKLLFFVAFFHQTTNFLNILLSAYLDPLKLIFSIRRISMLGFLFTVDEIHLFSFELRQHRNDPGHF